MMNNYKILVDEKLFLDFIEWLPELENNETFYACLFARSKYQNKDSVNKISHISSDKSQLKRFITDKDKFIYKIKQMESPLDSYVQYKNDSNHIPIPQECLAIYMTPNPRCQRKAMLGSLKKFADLICNGENIVNPSNFAMSEVQRSKSRTIRVDFDFDDINWDDIKSDIETILPDDSYSVIQTRGGIHVLVDPLLVKNINTKWYNQIKELPSVDQTGDCMIPVVGCYQGGFVPYFIKK